MATAHANALLNVLRGTTFTGLTVYLQMHTGDPGAAGTANAAAYTTGRQALSFAAASGGSMALSAATSAWTVSGGTETLTHWSIWDAATSGNLVRTGALTASKAVSTGDTYAQQTLTLAYSPLAA